MLKNFHFQEIGWIFSFPNSGNEGRKYLYYSVEFRDCRNGEAKEICLAEKVDSVAFEAHFPYTVGFFKGAIDEKTAAVGPYLEIRVVNSIEEFWKFLNDLNI